MKTVSVTEPGQVSLIDTPTPKPKDYQALVKTEVACICNNTDSELVAGHFPGMEESLKLGPVHEISVKGKELSVG
jgi:D-arabinose 1-dehydrogenase-like Zn-dependent alcohol dehydrogenase